MNSVLITGGTGSFGNAFVKRLLAIGQTKRIVIFSRGEIRQADMRSEIGEDDRLRYFIGDVRDRDRLRRAMRGVEVVVHAAALKRIEVGFFNPVEMVKTNIMGAVNIIEAAQDSGVQKVVALSSDKAFEPVSPYGTSKALAESLFLASNNTTGATGPKFAICRYGNVWRSNGSVVMIWEKMIKARFDAVPITDPECTRFFMKIEQAVDLVINTIETMKGGELVIPDLPAYRLGDLAEAMGIKTTIRGLPAWEKKHESMRVGLGSDKARRMTVDELREALRG
jgi:UDP-N-acetylglucosamine 4,6-dehydratase/5-epimerase